MDGEYCPLLQLPSGAWVFFNQRSPASTAFSLFSFMLFFCISALRAVPPARPAIVEGRLPIPLPIAAWATLDIELFMASLAGALITGTAACMLKVVFVAEFDTMASTAGVF